MNEKKEGKNNGLFAILFLDFSPLFLIIQISFIFRIFAGAAKVGRFFFNYTQDRQAAVHEGLTNKVSELQKVKSKKFCNLIKGKKRNEIERSVRGSEILGMGRMRGHAAALEGFALRRRFFTDKQ